MIVPAKTKKFAQLIAIPAIAILFPMTAIDCIANIPEPAACVKKAMISRYKKAFSMVLTALLPALMADCLILELEKSVI